jgi:hypothetical protein
MTAETAPAPTRQPHAWLQRTLLAVAAVELLNALLGLPNIFIYDPKEPGLIQFAQALVSLYLALAPLVCAAALWLAWRFRLRQAIMALGALALLSWGLDDIWTAAIHGFELDFSFPGQAMVFHHFVFPAVAAAGVVLANRDRQLPLAGLLVCFPTLYNWLMFFIFAGAMLIYGF